MANLFKATESQTVASRPYPLPEQWEAFLGYMYPDTRYLIKGAEGTRKSTFMLKVADMCGRMGNVLYVLAEEKLYSGTVQKRERHARVNLSRVDYLETPTYQEVHDALSNGNYKFCIIDSVNMLETDEVKQEDIMRLWEQFRIVFFYVAQMKKDYKDYRGSAALRHYVDVVIETSARNGVYTATVGGKNRMRRAKNNEVMTL